MTTKASNKKPAGATGPLWRVILVLAIAGQLLTAYLSWKFVAGADLAYCGEGSGCDLVQSSRWSIFLGIPMAMWGFATYTILALVAWRVHKPVTRWRWLWPIAVVGAAISLYLTFVSITEIEAACAYCLVSLGLICTIAVLASTQKPGSESGLLWSSWAPGTGVVAIVVVVLMHFHYSGIFDPAAGPETEFLKGLTEHLQATDAKFYGASWCPHCREQKALFGASAHRLPYVECAPGGRSGARSSECINANVNNYPTWIIRGRKFERIIEPEQLARLAAYEAIDPK